MKKDWTKAKSHEKDMMAVERGMADLQYACEEFIAGLEAKTWWHAKSFPWAKQLEEASPIIQEEFQAFRELEDSELCFTGAPKMGWPHMWLKSSRRVDPITSTFLKYFPKTLQVMEDLNIIQDTRSVMIERQLPGIGLKMCSTNSNINLTCHLGLDVPGENCYIGVGGEHETWKNNRLMFMDGSFLHYTRNASEKERIILSFTIWHPDITPQERNVLEYYDSLVAHASVGLPLPPHPTVLAQK
ncbi:unnamed protein product [Choristocarpus tenellus]